MKFGTRLYFAFGIMLVLMIALMIFAVSTLNNQNKEIKEVVKDRYDKVKLANVIRYDVGTIGRAINEVGINQKNQVQVQPQTVKAITAANYSIYRAVEDLDQSIYVNEAEELLGTLKVDYESYMMVVEQILSLDKDSNRFHIQELLMEAERDRIEVVDTIEQLIRLQERLNDFV
jgi:phosphoglycerate-specific signal transduction histidine kinase